MHPNFVLDQATFMDLCDQKRLTLLETLKALETNDPAIKSQLSMHFGLIEEEFIKELKVNFFTRVLTFPTEIHTATELQQYMIDTLVLLADDCIDTMYVLCSFMNKMGLPTDELWNEVQRTNMAKGVDGKVVRRADGKILKPDGWVAPNLRAIIMRHIGEQLGTEQDAVDRGG